MRNTVKVIGILAAILLVVVPLVYAQTSSPALAEYGTFRFGLATMDKDNFPKETAFLNRINADNKATAEEAEGSPMIEKMGQGMINTATSWVDIPRKMTEVSSEKDILAGCTVGFGEGLALGLTRGISGVYDMTTSGISSDEKPLMKPEYTVTHPDQGFKVALLEW